MEESLKILLAIGFGVLYFWLLSRRKPQQAKPDQNKPPVTKVPKPVVKHKKTFAKLADEIEDNKKMPLLTPQTEVSRNELKKPLLLTQKEKPETLALSQNQKKRKGENIPEREGGKKRAIEKFEDFKSEVDAQDLLDKEREKAYKIQQDTEHPLAKLLKDKDGLQNAMILSEILNRKY